MNNKINGYLINTYSKIILNGLLISFCLGLILNLFEEVEFFKYAKVSIFTPLLLTCIFVPSLVIKLSPFIIFISSIWFMVKIRNNKELLTL